MVKRVIHLLFNKTLLFMKLCTLLLISSLNFTVAAEPYAQKLEINIPVNNQTVGSVLDQITEKTGYDFFFNNKHVDLNRRVSVSVTNGDVFKVLDKVFEGTNVRYQLVDNKIILSVKGVINQQSEKRLIKGVVKDENGEPVIGANVLVKGTTNGTITDMDGNFSLEVSQGVVLQVSYIGFIECEVNVEKQTNLTIVLKEDSQVLEEVVVVGYGTMKKKDLLGAVSMVNGETLSTNSSISVGGALQGKMSGINILINTGFPGSDASINIRGVGTFGNGDSSPLVVIDGIPVDQGFETINPNDIESVNILKDASSAAIYGSRAANGVILITTKKGVEGKAKVVVNATWGKQTPSHMMDLLNADEFVSAVLEMRENKKAIDGGNPITKYDGLKPSDFGVGTNWGDYIYTSAPTFNLNANVSSGTKNINFYLSGELLNQKGIAINTGYKKAGLRSNIEAKINSRLKIGNNVNMTYRYTEGNSRFRYSDVIFNAPITVAYDEDGSYGEPNNKLTGSKNAIAEVGWYTPYNHNYRLIDNLFVEYQIIDGLRFRFNGGIDMVYNEYKSFYPKYNDGGVTNTTNKYVENRSKNFMWLTDYLLYFDKTFDKHTVNVMGGFSQQLFTRDNLSGTVKDFVSEVENMQVIDGGTNAREKLLRGGKSELALASYFGRVNYDYNERYLFSVNLRVDGSSRFKGDNRWGVFPSLSGAWRVSEEDFFDVKNISNLKLRVSLGKLGNQSIGSWYPTIAAVDKQNVVFGPSADQQVISAGYSQTQLGNRSLKWETTSVTNLGIDLGLFNNRLFMTADYFIKNTDGILRQMVLPPSVGLSAPNMNYAEVQNKGFDIEISYKGKMNDLNFSIAGNVSFLHNEIKELSSGVDEEIVNIGCYGGVVINRVGEPISALYGYKTGDVITIQKEADKYKAMGQGNAKIGRLKYIDLNGDGVITGKDRTILGSYIPKITAGMTLSANWKKFDFNLVLSGVFGRKQHSPMSFQNRMPNRNMSRRWYDNRWKLGDNPVGKFPAIIQGENYQEMTDLMVTNASFLKIKALTLGYTVCFQRIKARVYVSGENLITFRHKDFDGFDPENGNSVGHYTNWGDDFPTPRILLIGTNLTF